MAASYMLRLRLPWHLLQSRSTHRLWPRSRHRREANRCIRPPLIEFHGLLPRLRPRSISPRSLAHAICVRRPARDASSDDPTRDRCFEVAHPAGWRGWPGRVFYRNFRCRSPRRHRSCRSASSRTFERIDKARRRPSSGGTSKLRRPAGSKGCFGSLDSLSRPTSLLATRHLRMSYYLLHKKDVRGDLVPVMSVTFHNF